MNPIGLKLHFCLWAALPAVLNAQPARSADPIRLRYWPAPLYWHSGTPPQESAVTAAASLPAGASPLVFVAMTPCRVVDHGRGNPGSDATSPSSVPL
jgi:hypothetical protein